MDEFDIESLRRQANLAGFNEGQGYFDEGQYDPRFQEDWNEGFDDARRIKEVSYYWP